MSVFEHIQRRAHPNAWDHIAPGDIGYDRGGGFVGWAIGVFTRTAQSHCYIYVEPGDGSYWWTHEARGGGPLTKCRRTQPPNKVHRIWRNRAEAQAIIAASGDLLGRGYDYREIVRICLTMLGLPVLRAKDNAGKVICSNHVAQCVQAARPDIPLSYEPHSIWPGRLAEDLDEATWTDATAR